PLVKKFLNTDCNFDSLQISLDESNFTSPLRYKGMIHAVNLNILHPKLSDDTIHIIDIANFFSVTIGKNFLELDSTSYIQLNKLPLMINARYDKSASESYSLAIKTGRQNAGNFFSSLPRGMFSELQGIDAEGTLDFKLRFHLDAAEPDSLYFDSQM